MSESWVLCVLLTPIQSSSSSSSSPYSNAYCNIKKNNAYQIYIYLDPVQDNGYYVTSKSITLHLNLGDRADPGECTGDSSMWDLTSLTGFFNQS